MKAKRIKKLAEDLRKNFDTNNPFVIAEKFGIKMIISDKIPLERKAYTVKFENNPTMIIINGKYEYRSQVVLCAHELGHALLHSQGVNDFAVTSRNISQNVEYEANLFAVSLLFQEEDFNVRLLSMSNYLLKEILDYNIKKKE